MYGKMFSSKMFQYEVTILLVFYSYYMHRNIVELEMVYLGAK